MGKPLRGYGIASIGAGNLASGHWSNPNCYIRLNQVADSILALLTDKLVAQGKWVDLWLPVASTTAGVVICSCVKNTTESSDRSCLSCHGTKLAPGYQKFLHETQFWCSAEEASFTLTNIVRLDAKKANVLVLDPAATSGIVQTQVKTYAANPDAAPWEIKAELYRRATGSTFVVVYSLDGSTWTPVTMTEVSTTSLGGNGTGFAGTILASALNSAGGSIQFRVTMTRSSVNDLTPAFEIIRMRRARVEDTSSGLRVQRGDFSEGSILVLKPWVVEKDELDPNRGRLVDHLNDMMWTVPLNTFDTSLTAETPATRIQDHDGPHAFYEIVSGVLETDRYAITQISVNDRFDIFTQQSLVDRRIQRNESYAKVW